MLSISQKKEKLWIKLGSKKRRWSIKIKKMRSYRILLLNFKLDDYLKRDLVSGEDQKDLQNCFKRD